MSSPEAPKVKDPAAVLDYRFQWGRGPFATAPPWLEDTETITSKQITVQPAGLTVEESEITPDGKDVVVWLSGGTVSATYEVACQITTTLSRTDVRRMSIYVLER
ncbi:putative virion-associated phage protein [Nocardia nova SH22a]|uniref:Putative virion-associated phage protein n=1 Tax=Nocardia nova SH22a TaxID=1415166 RepID=W5TPP1_9NOCA|nr:hypothetical protein [Nocardia nova]AHH20873.1 putative virion-associated phage protein [Nocardia nova SH22a]